MANIGRRAFLGTGAAMAAALGVDVSDWRAAAEASAARDAAGRAPSGSSDREPPDLVVVNARVWTVDERLPRAEAFAVQHGRFTAVGTNADVRALAGASTRIVDAAGMTVTPGFIDTHSHPSGVNELTGVNVNLRTVAEVVAALRAKAATTPPGYWVTGYMYDDTKLDRPVTRRDLDEAVPTHPASVNHRGGHTGVYNSVAFKEAGVTATTPDPEGGRFYREGGELTGKVAERARSAFNRVGERDPVTRETRQKGVAFISKEMTKAAGLVIALATAVGVGSVSAQADEIVVESATMRAGQPIPRDHSPDGRNESPPLTWRGLPAAAREVAVLCEDYGAGNPPPWVHWIIYNVPASATGLTPR